MRFYRWIQIMVSIICVSCIAVGCGLEDKPEPTNITITLNDVRSEPKQIDLEVVSQNNCGGSADAENQISRSHSVERLMEIGTQLEINAKGEVKIFGTGVDLGGSVANNFGYSYGQSEIIQRSVNVKAAAGTHMEHHISHQEIWKVGDATVFVNGRRQQVPYRFRTDFALVLLESIQIRDCSLPTPLPTYTQTSTPVTTTPRLTDTPIPPTVTDTPLPTSTSTSTLIATLEQPTSTPTPATIGTITVPSNTNLGTKFTAVATGQYIFRYINGAYSTYSIDAAPKGMKTWLTAVRAFKNRNIEWNGIAISNLPDINITDYGFQASSTEAEVKAKGSIATIFLQKGDYLILVAVDGMPYYSDNPGQVVFEIQYMP